MRSSSKMQFSTAKTAIDFLSSIHTQVPIIRFYGGEPFLEYELMQQVITYCGIAFPKDQQPKYSVTTNGLLLREDILSYCNNKGFEIYLSIDGNKRAHECGRGKGSFEKIQAVINLIKSLPHIFLKTYSVITPQNVKYLCESIDFLIGIGAQELCFSFQLDCEWESEALQMLKNNFKEALFKLCKYRSQGGKVYIEGLNPRPSGIFFVHCNPGEDRVTVTTEGYVYGCSMHIPWSVRAMESNTTESLSSLCFGHINNLNRAKLNDKLNMLSSDKRLSGQYSRYTAKKKCSQCEYIQQCAVCPIISLINSEDPFLIPEWVCEIKQIIFKTSSVLKE